MTVVLRPLTVDDLDRVDELEVELFGPGAWPRSVYVEELAAPNREYVAAVESGVLVGYAGVALGGDAEIMTIGVAAPWRRLGIGARLLDSLVATARRARAARVFLEVRASDEAAQRLYARAGFRAVGLRRGYYEHEGEDAVVMRLDLAGTRIGSEVAPARTGEADGETP